MISLLRCPINAIGHFLCSDIAPVNFPIKLTLKPKSRAYARRDSLRFTQYNTFNRSNHFFLVNKYDDNPVPNIS